MIEERDDRTEREMEEWGILNLVWDDPSLLDDPEVRSAASAELRRIYTPPWYTYPTTREACNWAPLIGWVTEAGAGDWMYMCCFWGHIHAYKHCDTRRYLLIDTDGTVMQEIDPERGLFVTADPETAIREAYQ